MEGPSIHFLFDSFDGVKRIPREDFLELQRLLDQRLPRVSQQIFMDFVLKNIDFGEEDKEIPGKHHWKDITKIFLYSLLYPSSHRDQIRWKVKKTTWARIFEFLLEKSKDFDQEWVTPLDYPKRKEISSHHLSGKWKKVTLFWDGTHCPTILYTSKKEGFKDHYSFKLKRSALNTQVYVLLFYFD